MRRIAFSKSALEDFVEWAILDKKIFLRINQLISDIQRTPYSGIGKPEALRFEWSGYWSRRINEEHRLVYQVNKEDIAIVSCKYHYSK